MAVAAEWLTIRGLLIDLDGVVFTGQEPIPGSAAFLSRARQQGVPFLLVTNNSTASPEQVAERLATMDIVAQPAEILTSAQAAAAFVRANTSGTPRVRLVGESGLRQAAQEEGLDIVDDGHLEAPAGAFATTLVDWVIAGLDRQFDYQKLTSATRAILAGARFVATNADALLPIEGGNVIPGAGSIVGAIQIATGAQPIVIGKPEPGMFQVGLQRLGHLKPHTVAMIGDRLDTDVVGGARAGLRTILALSGVTDPRQLAASSVRPDAVVPNLGAVADLFGW